MTNLPSSVLSNFEQDAVEILGFMADGMPTHCTQIRHFYQETETTLRYFADAHHKSSLSKFTKLKVAADVGGRDAFFYSYHQLFNGGDAAVVKKELLRDDVEFTYRPEPTFFSAQCITNTGLKPDQIAAAMKDGKFDGYEMYINHSRSSGNDADTLRMSKDDQYILINANLARRLGIEIPIEIPVYNYAGITLWDDGHLNKFTYLYVSPAEFRPLRANAGRAQVFDRHRNRNTSSNTLVYWGSEFTYVNDNGVWHTYAGGGVGCDLGALSRMRFETATDEILASIPKAWKIWSESNLYKMTFPERVSLMRKIIKNLHTQSAAPLLDCEPKLYGHSEKATRFLPFILADERPGKHEKVLYMGVELEIDVPNRNHKYVYDLLDGFAIAKRDGSLNESRGLEINTAPANLKAHALMWKGFFETMAGKLTMSHAEYGMHVHIPKKAFSGQPIHLMKFLGFWNSPANMAFHTAVCRRGENTYAMRDGNQTLTNAKSFGIVARQIRSGRGLNRRMITNLTNEHTIEVRIFRAVTNYADFMSNLEYMKATFEYAQIIDWKKQDEEQRVVKGVPVYGMHYKDFLLWLNTQQGFEHLKRHLVACGHSLKTKKVNQQSVAA